MVVGKGYRRGGPRHPPGPTDRRVVDPAHAGLGALGGEHLFRGRPVAPTDIVESLSILTNIGLLLRAPYVALMPRTAARQFSDAGLLRILDLPEMGAFGTVGYTLRLHREPSAACRTFIACCAMPRRMGATRRSSARFMPAAASSGCHRFRSA